MPFILRRISTVVAPSSQSVWTVRGIEVNFCVYSKSLLYFCLSSACYVREFAKRQRRINTKWNNNSRIPRNIVRFRSWESSVNFCPGLLKSTISIATTKHTQAHHPRTHRPSTTKDKVTNFAHGIKIFRVNTLRSFPFSGATRQATVRHRNRRDRARQRVWVWERKWHPTNAHSTNTKRKKAFTPSAEQTSFVFAEKRLVYCCLLH